MKKYYFFVLISANIYSQNIQNNQSLDSIANIVNLDGVTVNSLRAKDNSPVPVSYTHLTLPTILLV